MDDIGAVVEVGEGVGFVEALEGVQGGFHCCGAGAGLELGESEFRSDRRDVGFCLEGAEHQTRPAGIAGGVCSVRVLLVLSEHGRQVGSERSGMRQ